MNVMGKFKAEMVEQVQDVDLSIMMTSKSVVNVGGGRGFVVKHGHQRFVLTAAHCLPRDRNGRVKLPPPLLFSSLQERTYPRWLGPLGTKRAKLTVWAECVFVDPVADIAVLGAPDNEVTGYDEDVRQAYEDLVAGAKPLAIADAPKMGRERVIGGSFENRTPGKGFAFVLSLDGEWRKCAVTRPGRPGRLVVEDEGLIEGGMSGSPIVSMDGKAIGLVSTDEVHPVLRDNLPAWFFRR